MGNVVSDLDENTAVTGTGEDAESKGDMTEKTWDSQVDQISPSKRSETPETATSNSVEQDASTYPEVGNIQVSRSSYTGIPKVTDSEERTARTDMAHEGSFECPIVLYEDDDEDVLFDDENVYEDPDIIVTPRSGKSSHVDRDDEGYDGGDDNDDGRNDDDDEYEDEVTLLTEVEVKHEGKEGQSTQAGDVPDEIPGHEAEGEAATRDVGRCHAEDEEEEIILEEYTFTDDAEDDEREAVEQEEEIILEDYTYTEEAQDEQEAVETKDDTEEKIEEELEALQSKKDEIVAQESAEDAQDDQQVAEYEEVVVVMQGVAEEAVPEENIVVVVNYDGARDDESQVEKGAIEIYGTDDVSQEGDDEPPPECVTAVRSSDLKYAWAVNRLEQTFSNGASSPVSAGSPRSYVHEETKPAAQQQPQGGPIDPDGESAPKLGNEEPRSEVREVPSAEVQGSFSREMDGEAASEASPRRKEQEDTNPEEQEDERIAWAKKALSSLGALSSESEDIDLAFVEEYEGAFEAFLEKHPHFLSRDPDLVENLRIAKLQKLLERTFQAEFEMMDYLEYITAQKEEMAASYQSQLIEASRRRAAREIALQQDLTTIQQETRTMGGKMTWQMITKCATRAKKHQALVHKFNERPSNLLDVLPDYPETQAIRDAVTAPPGTNLSEEQEKDLRQFQVDNAFLNAEVSVLEKKLAYHQVSAKKHGWVDLVFLKMDPKRMKKLKHRYQKKLGVTF